MKALLTLLLLALFTSAAPAQTTKADVLQRRATREAAVAAKQADVKKYFTAVQLNQPKLVELMIHNGVPLDAQNANGDTGLTLAARAGNMEVLKTLQKLGANLSQGNRHGDTAMMLAALGGRDDILQWLLKQGVSVNKTGWTPLHYAALAGENDTVNLLIDNLADIDAKAPNGVTPLMMAVREGKAATVRLLLSRGADVTARSDRGDSALDWAQRHPDRSVVTLLKQAEKNRINNMRLR
jgi:ankyrin repeat protein